MEECGSENREEMGGDLYGATRRYVKAIDAGVLRAEKKSDKGKIDLVRYFGKLAAKGGALQQEFCVKHG